MTEFRPSEWGDIIKEIRDDTDKVIAQNLLDPDLRQKSQDYQDGYAHGFHEAAMAFVAQRLKTIRAADG